MERLSAHFTCKSLSCYRWLLSPFLLAAAASTIRIAETWPNARIARYGKSKNNELAYTLPVPEQGTYLVRMFFVDACACTYTENTLYGTLSYAMPFPLEQLGKIIVKSSTRIDYFAHSRCHILLLRHVHHCSYAYAQPQRLPHVSIKQ
jgi:hypothetical protein